MGLLAAALTEFVTRTQPLGGGGATLVAGVGALLIQPNKPESAPG